MLRKTLRVPRGIFRLFPNGKKVRLHHNNPKRKTTYPQSVGIKLMGLKFLDLEVVMGVLWSHHYSVDGKHSSGYGKMERRKRERRSECETFYLKCHGQPYYKWMVNVS